MAKPLTIKALENLKPERRRACQVATGLSRLGSVLGARAENRLTGGRNASPFWRVFSASAWMMPRWICSAPVLVAQGRLTSLSVSARSSRDAGPERQGCSRL